jgi:hypothetical protein
MDDHDLINAFEDWFLAIPDVDETLIDAVDTDGCYTDKTIIGWFSLFKAGYGYGKISR